MPAEASHTDPLSHLPGGGNVGSERHGAAYHLMTRHAPGGGIGVLDVAPVGAADAADLGPDQHLSGLRNRNRPLCMA